MPNKLFIAITLTKELEKCAWCGILLKRGDGAMLSGKTLFMCDADCVQFWRAKNEKHGLVEFLDSLAVFN